MYAAAESVGGMTALEELRMAGQYEGHSQAAFDVGSLDGLHALQQLHFLSLVCAGLDTKPEAVNP